MPLIKPPSPPLPPFLSSQIWRWLLFFYIFFSHSLYAQDFIVEKAWLEDPSGQMGWQEAQAAPMQSFEGVLNRGFSNAPLWIRVRVAPTGISHISHVSHLGGVEQPLALRLRPAYVDRIEVFDALGGGLIGVLGDRQHPKLEDMRGLDYLLPLARSTEARDIWLKLSSRSTRQVYVEVLSLHDLSKAQLQQSLFVSLYLGISLVLMVWGWVAGRLQREKVLSYFSMMQFFGLLYGMSSLGVLHLLWPDWLDAALLDGAGSLFVLLAVASGIWFHLQFLQTFHLAPWALRLLQALLGVTLLNLVLLLVGQVRPALQLNILVVICAAVLTFLASFFTRAWVQQPHHLQPVASGPGFAKIWLVGLYTLLLVVLLITTTTIMGWLKATQWSMYISLIQGLVTSILLVMMLQFRAYTQKQQRQQALLALESSRLQVLHEQAAREEHEKLLMMLAHEIKNPLATIHLRLPTNLQGNTAIGIALREMNEVIERCTQTLRLGDGKLEITPRVFDLVDMLNSATAATTHPEYIAAQLPQTLPLCTDPKLLFIIISNLLENACKYAPPQATIGLDCRVMPNQAMARLRICNPPGKAGYPDAKRVFDKYYRSPPGAKGVGDGAGALPGAQPDSTARWRYLLPAQRRADLLCAAHPPASPTAPRCGRRGCQLMPVNGN